MKFRRPVFIVTLLLSMSLLAQVHRPVINFLTRENGLISENVHAIAQDSEGFIWIGTDEGIQRFDGYNFKFYQDTVPHKLSRFQNYIHQIVQDGNKPEYLWLAAPIGLKRFNINSGKFVHFYFNDLLEQSDASRVGVFSICPAKDSLLWLGTYSSGLIRFNRGDNSWKSFQMDTNLPAGVAKSAIYDIKSDSYGNLWLGTNRGLYRFNVHKNTFQNMNDTLKLAPDPINAILKDREGSFWIAAKQGELIRYDPESRQIKRTFAGTNSKGKNFFERVHALLEDRAGNIWIATRGSGLLKFQKKENYFYELDSGDSGPQLVASENLSTLFLDRRGLIWVGSFDKGISKFKNISGEFNYVYVDSQVTEKNRNLIAKSFVDYSQNIIWVGCVTPGLLEFDTRANKLQKNRNPRLNTIRSILSMIKDNQDNFWLGTSRDGIYRYNPQKNKLTNYDTYVRGNSKRNHAVYSFFIDQKENLWAGTSRGGLFKYDQSTDSFVQQALLDELTNPGVRIIVSQIYQVPGQEDYLWIATLRNGLIKYNIRNGRTENQFVHNYRDRGSLCDNKVTCLQSDILGNLWIGTQNGLNRLTLSTEQIKRMDDLPGLLGSSIQNMHADQDGYIWFTVKKSLYRLDPSSETLRLFGPMEGLDVKAFRSSASQKTSDGFLYFATKKGFIYFNPHRINQREIKPRVMITDIKLNQLSSPLSKPSEFSTLSSRQDSISLDYAEYMFMFNLALTDYADPGRNQFRYKLEGYDRNWYDIGNLNRLTFYNLPPQKYTLMVHGGTGDGAWSDLPATFYFTINPPFWQTWWFRMVLLIFLIALVYGGYQLRIITIRNRNVELENINKKLNKEIAARNQIEQMLRESEQKYRALIEAIDEPVFVIDHGGRFVYYNRVAAERLDYTPAGFEGKNLLEIFPNEFGPTALARVRQVIRTKKPIIFNAVIPFKGRERHFRVALQPFEDILFKTTQAFGLATEITDIVDLERQLRQSQKIEAVGLLAGGIAHDFNNLLSIIRGYSYMLLQDMGEDDAGYESIKEIDEAGERAQLLTRQLLAFGRKQLLEPRVIEVNSLIGNVQKMLSRVIGEDIQLITDLDAELDNIFADPGQIEQVFMNLAINARDAMPDGGLLKISTRGVKVSANSKPKRHKMEVGNYVMITVSDTGVGMSQQVLDQIFDPFFTTKDPSKGTGLGLSTVFGIVKQSGGYIWVDSTPGEGSVFTIYFPSVSKHAIAPESDTRVKRNIRGTETILVTEDEDGVRKMIGKMLKLYGYTIVEASNAREAIHKFKAMGSEIDLALADVVMPEMNGIDLIKELRKQRDDLNVLFMSGYTDAEIVRHGVLDRGINFIQKPFTPEQLALRIRKILTSNGD